MASSCYFSSIPSEEDVFIEPPEEDFLIGDYRLLQSLGKGFFAEVRLAQHVQTGRQVAVKVIQKHNTDAASLQQLYQEVEIMQILDHPNIVKLLDVIDTTNILYLVMEYVSGGDLKQYLINHGRMDEERSRVLFRQMVSAVYHCHQKYVVHFDIKPENILVEADGNIKISDFGVSELFTPKQKEDFQVEEDIWALGVVLYELVTCTLPIKNPKPVEMRQLDFDGCYEIPTYISADCEQLLCKLLFEDPSLKDSLEGVMHDRWVCLDYDGDIVRSIVPESCSESPEGKDGPSVANRKVTTFLGKRTRPITPMDIDINLDISWICEPPSLKRPKLVCGEDQRDNNIFVTSTDAFTPFAAEPLWSSVSSEESDDEKPSIIITEDQPSTSGKEGRKGKWRRFWDSFWGLFCSCTS